LSTRCTQFIDRDGTSKALEDDMRADIIRMKDQWSMQGKRVVLLARKVLHKTELYSDPKATQFEKEVLRQAESELTLVGLVGIVDPPRNEIPFVVKALRGAGIRIFMVRYGSNMTLHTTCANLMTGYR
jgi:sodium/potassium-transporting ATPase subunit alpha